MLPVGSAPLTPTVATGGGYSGPLSIRQGKPMRPDVALAFDRMERAARADGVGLIVNSGYRSDAEQAVLWAQNPNPHMVARPGTSLHRLGTELDLGPAAAYGWLAANARAFGFIQRYSWEDWHYGYIHNARSRPGGAADGERGAGHADGEREREMSGGGSMPSFVPERFAPAISRAAQRWNVSATLLSAQLYRESTFNPTAVSQRAPRGSLSSCPRRRPAYGLRNPFDPEASIDAQAHLMHDLLRQFGSVPLALAAYNTGPARVRACGCPGPSAEPREYVAAIMALMGAAGEGLAVPGGGLVVRLTS